MSELDEDWLEAGGRWICNEAVQVGDVILDPGTPRGLPLRVTEVIPPADMFSNKAVTSVRGTSIPRPNSDDVVMNMQYDLPMGKFVFLANRPQKFTGRYWVGFQTHSKEFKGAFPEWHTGSDMSDPVWYWCTGDVYAPNPKAAFALVRASYPDAIVRFCSERELDWKPSPDRFPPHDASVTGGDE